MALTAVVVATAGNRPLLPLPAMWEKLATIFPGNPFVADQSSRYAESDYQAAKARAKFLNESLPPGETVVGYYPILCDVDEPCLWLPYGGRRVECISRGDSPERLRALNIRYVLVHLHSEDGSISEWMEKYHGTLTAHYAFPGKSDKSFTPQDLYLVRLN